MITFPKLNKKLLFIIVFGLSSTKLFSSLVLVNSSTEQNNKDDSPYSSNSNPIKFWKLVGSPENPFLADAMDSFGIKNSTKQWELMWTTENWELEDVRLSENARDKGALKQKKKFTNIIPGIPSRKELALQHQSCIEQHEVDDCDYTPVTFLLPEQTSLWRQYSRVLDSSTLWVLRSRDTQNETKEIITSSFNVRQLKGNWTSQSYWKHLMLFKGRKFDFRCWVLISSVDPLRIWMFNSGIPRTSPVTFSADWSHLNDHCMHLTAVNISCDQESSVAYFNTNHPKFLKELSKSDGSRYS